MTLLLAGAGLGIWLYLVFARGGFWRADVDDSAWPLPSTPLPDVVAIMPARDEAAVVAESVGSLLRQSYPGRLEVLLVDDGSSDETAAVARAAAGAAGAGDRLTILQGQPLAAGWTGKLFAMHQGVLAVGERPSPPVYVLFTDADIAYEPDTVARLVAFAGGGGTVLTSLMAKLRCESPAEHLLVPAFIYFFQKLYPFRWVNDPARSTAAAAGGCMLVRRETLEAAGGIAAIRGALIDDCALGRRMKTQGPIWLGLTARVRSLRPYPHLADIRRMVVRSAYAELRYSPWRLAGAVIGMIATYMLPPVLVIAADGPVRLIALATLALMLGSFVPIQRIYGRSPLAAVLLPAIAATYTLFTVQSAWLHSRGRGGAWKGRFQAARGDAT